MHGIFYSMPTGVRDTQVINLKNQRVGEDQLKVYWDKPKTQAEVLYYEVSYKIKKSDVVEENAVNTVSSFRALLHFPLVLIPYFCY